MIESNVKDFFNDSDDERANEITIKFFADALDGNENFATVAAAIAFIIFNISEEIYKEKSSQNLPLILKYIASLALDTKINEHPLN